MAHRMVGRTRFKVRPGRALSGDEQAKAGEPIWGNPCERRGCVAPSRGVFVRCYDGVAREFCGGHALEELDAASGRVRNESPGEPDWSALCRHCGDPGRKHGGVDHPARSWACPGRGRFPTYPKGETTEDKGRRYDRFLARYWGERSTRFERGGR